MKRTNKRMEMKGYKYKIGYLDPTDLKGMKFKTWWFKTLNGVKSKQADLMVFWQVNKNDVPIKRL